MHSHTSCCYTRDENQDKTYQSYDPDFSASDTDYNTENYVLLTQIKGKAARISKFK